MKRWTLGEDEDMDGNMNCLGMEEDPDGDWVRYEDAMARIAALERELSEALRWKEMNQAENVRLKLEAMRAAVTDAERAVLAACAEADIVPGDEWTGPRIGRVSQEEAIAVAEDARRRGAQ